MGGALWIGTSGFVYRHWQKGVFYPADLPARQELEYYARQFDSVELNNPFYRLPARGIFERWAARVPARFRIAVKAPRVITHYKKLLHCEAQPEKYWEQASGLGDQFGVTLFQFPASWDKDAERLREFLVRLPRKPKSVFEFRHASWMKEEVYKLLDHAGAGFCTAVHPGLPLPAGRSDHFVQARTLTSKPGICPNEQS